MLLSPKNVVFSAPRVPVPISRHGRLRPPRRGVFDHRVEMAIWSIKGDLRGIVKIGQKGQIPQYLFIILPFLPILTIPLKSPLIDQMASPTLQIIVYGPNYNT